MPQIEKYKLYDRSCTSNCVVPLALSSCKESFLQNSKFGTTG